MRALATLLLACVAACGSEHASSDAAPSDAAPQDGGVSQGLEIVSGGGHVSGGSLSADVEIGHPIVQSKIQGGTFELEGAAVVKPRGDGP